VDYFNPKCKEQHKSSQRRGIILDLPDPSKPSNFYQCTIHLFYGIIIAQSYEIAKNTIIPIGNIFSDSSHQLHSFGLFLSYFLIISSWTGYFRSISKKPHEDTLAGTTRYIFDIIIVFMQFYLLHLSTTDDFASQFHIVLLIIFGLYVIWDWLKCKEYPEPVTQKKKRVTSRAGKTGLFLIFFIIFSSGYQFLSFGIWDQIFSNHQVFEISFIILASVLIAVYRFWKWRVPTTRTHISIKNNKSKKQQKTKS
jgi:protein-S-isoprenylcysteine O-methyltransferase Ste14